MSKLILGAHLFLGAIGLIASGGCGGDTEGSAGTGGGRSTGGASGAGCPNVAGAWKVSKHCQAALIGTSVQVSQQGCAFTDETYGFTGTLHSDGTLTVASSGASATCTGTVTASAISENCTVAGQPCMVSLTR